ncbi:hypothetical protein FIBSPDRAFT_928062 [Athelia psychrophila]|uniref:BTB domain-containing protein n=1 Tax=Athelia psychrophila TaxID=1759441 RepID=A0A166QU30_9AGAM|nr:hypothetical protein FIBSPDRAFT_928062 [Fibularhizoctonia sp. CBS 109695]
MSGDDKKPSVDPPALTKSIGFFVETVTFLVQEELFKVPRLYFEKNSSIFNDIFQGPATKNREGSSDNLPIVLESIKKVDFERLLMAMFPEPSLSRYIPQPINMTVREWTSVLKLSTLWRFGELRHEAIEELTKLLVDSPAEQVALGREYRVEDWMRKGYTMLLQRESALTQKEREILGAPITVKVYEAREATFRTGNGAKKYGGFNGSRDLASVDNLVISGFGEELNDASYDGEAIEEDSKLALDAGRPKKKK